MEHTNAFCTFLVELTQAALGGGSKSDGEVGIDTGEGIEELSDEQIENLIKTLGEADFYRMYPQMKPQ